MQTHKKEDIVVYARDWFTINSIDIPSTAQEWQASSVRRKEIPPGCTTITLRKFGISVKWLIESIKGKEQPCAQPKVPMDYTAIGFRMLECTMVNSHKKCKVQCTLCGVISILDYGTLSRMRKRGDKYCHTCRGVGGKSKDISVYDRGEYTCIKYCEGIVTYTHMVCGYNITRTYSAVSNGVSPICDHCYPRDVFGVKTAVDGILFPSKLEAEVYKEISSICTERGLTFSRQVPYSEIFPSITSKHTADFYINELDIIIEAGNINTSRYKDTTSFKLGISDKVNFVSSPNQVIDIFRRHI